MTITEKFVPARGFTAETNAARGSREQTSFLSLAGATLEQRDRLRRSLARLAALDVPHLSPLRRIAERADGFSLTYCVASGSVSWAELTARRPATVAETVAVGLALCQALGALHVSGLAHGRVGADLVRVSPGGVVELAGCAVAWAPGAGVVPTGADDVRDLVVLLTAGFDAGTLGGELALLLLRGADPDPAQRPTVPALGRALEAQCSPVAPFPSDFPEPPVPVDAGVGPGPGDPLPGVVSGLGVSVTAGVGDATADPVPSGLSGRGVPEPVEMAHGSGVPALAVVPGAGVQRSPRLRGPLLGRQRSSHWLRGSAVHPLRWLQRSSDQPPQWRWPDSMRRLWRRRRSLTRPLLLALAAVIGVGLVMRGLSGLAGSGQDAATVSAAPEAHMDADAGVAGFDWRRAVGQLDVARTAAMTGGSPSRLAMVVDPDGPAYARDVATLTARAHAGLHLVGGEVTVRSAVPLEVGIDRAEVTVVDTRADYRLIGPDGQVVLVGPARASASWRVSLVRDGSGMPWRIHDAVRR